jgi:hypothetical protein
MGYGRGLGLGFEMGLGCWVPWRKGRGLAAEVSGETATHSADLDTMMIQRLSFCGAEISAAWAAFVLEGLFVMLRMRTLGCLCTLEGL